MLSKRTRERGDTLVEVLFAVSVFSMVVVGALAVMNQGTAASNRALDITLVRQQIDAQAETLRYMHEEYVAVYYPSISFNTSDTETSPAEEWYKMVNHIKNIDAASASSLSVGAHCPYPPNGNLPVGSFITNPVQATFVNESSLLIATDTLPHPSIRSDGSLESAKGIWIEAIRSPDNTDPTKSNVGFIDFHIRACWDSLGLPVPMSMGTIVRLYEPRA